MRDILGVNLKKVKGKIIFKTRKDKEKYIDFTESIDEKDFVQVLIFKNDTKKTLKKLAKIHVMIKEISLEIGEASSVVKKLVKDKALLKDVTGEYKSFADCSSEELSLAIEECKLMFNFLSITDF